MFLCWLAGSGPSCCPFTVLGSKLVAEVETGKFDFRVLLYFYLLLDVYFLSSLLM